jgi:DNA-binding NtrC family response regulator
MVRPEDLPKEFLEGSGEPRGRTAEGYHWDGKDDFQTAKGKVIERFEREILCAALLEHQGNISQAARVLGLHRQNLQQKLRRLGISAEDFKVQRKVE